MGRSWDILSSFGAKFLPTFLMSAILNAGPKVYVISVIGSNYGKPLLSNTVSDSDTFSLGLCRCSQKSWLIT